MLSEASHCINFLEVRGEGAHYGRNHVNKTASNGIVAHRLWEENLGNVTKVFDNDSFGFIARSLRFCCPNAISERNNFGLLFSLLG